jgi:hypothetical protein
LDEPIQTLNGQIVDTEDEVIYLKTGLLMSIRDSLLP